MKAKTPSYIFRELLTDRKDWPWYSYLLLPFVIGYWREDLYIKVLFGYAYPMKIRKRGV